MTETQSSISLPGSAQWMITSLEAQVRPVAERITQQIHASVPELSGRGAERFTKLVFTATHNAMRLFVDRAQGREHSGVGVDDLFRKLGYREAARGRDHEVIDRAMQIAVTEIWDELRTRAATNELSAGALNALNEAVTDFIDHLTEQIAIGYRSGTEARDQDVGVARSRLLEHLLTGGEPEEIEVQAAVARWEVPDAVSVLAVDVPMDQSLLTDALGDLALTLPGSPQVVICATEDVDAVLALVKSVSAKARVVICWPVPAGDVPAAWKWVNRALALVRARVIPDRPVIDCARHRTEIWLHAEPVLRRQLAQELLQPLFNETENSREILSETLLVWLETRDSAPAIAARLGVHPQTVRYRWKRINELFGDDLHDPDFVIQMTLLLKASVPLWLAGDQSDFERFRDREVG